MDISTLITCETAAKQIGVSKKRMAKLCADGRVSANRLGKRLWVIDPDSLAEYASHPDREKFTPHTFSPGSPGLKRRRKHKKA